MSVVFVKNSPALEPGIRAYRIDFQKGFASIPPRGLKGSWLAREKLRIGATIMYLGHPGPALSELKQGLSLAPEDFGLNYYTGLALNSLQRYPEALPYLEKAARLEPEDIPNSNEQAWAYFATGRSGEAIAIYRQVLAKHPKEITTCMNLALVYELSKSELAYPQWQSCGEICKSDPKAYELFYPEIEQALSRLGK
jgi:tetratricopeptide (TPR) repeat protein